MRSEGLVSAVKTSGSERGGETAPEERTVR